MINRQKQKVSGLYLKEEHAVLHFKIPQIVRGPPIARVF